MKKIYSFFYSLIFIVFSFIDVTASSGVQGIILMASDTEDTLNPSDAQHWGLYVLDKNNKHIFTFDTEWCQYCDSNSVKGQLNHFDHNSEEQNGSPSFHYIDNEGNITHQIPLSIVDNNPSFDHGEFQYSTINRTGGFTYSKFLSVVKLDNFPKYNTGRISQINDATAAMFEAIQSSDSGKINACEMAVAGYFQKWSSGYPENKGCNPFTKESLDIFKNYKDEVFDNGTSANNNNKDDHMNQEEEEEEEEEKEREEEEKEREEEKMHEH
ncbi:MAG: hypothetical protein Q8S21_03815 [Candidatus Paracaedibacteraceae bacterium]|nr:hypothetical protein [Candidatus Paracaedibacteraceae bacterium]